MVAFNFHWPFINFILLPWIIWSKNNTLHRLFWNQNHLLKFSKSLGGDFGNPKLPGVTLKVFDRFFIFFLNLSLYYLRLYYNSIFILTAVQHNNVVVRYTWIVLVLYFYCRFPLSTKYSSAKSQKPLGCALRFLRLPRDILPKPSRQSQKPLGCASRFLRLSRGFWVHILLVSKITSCDFIYNNYKLFKFTSHNIIPFNIIVKVSNLLQYRFCVRCI